MHTLVVASDPSVARHVEYALKKAVFICSLQIVAKILPRW